MIPIIISVVVLLIIRCISTVNDFKKKAVRVQEGLSGVEVALTKCCDMLTKMPDTANGYMNMNPLLAATGMSDYFFDSDSFDFGSLSDTTSTHKENFNNRDSTAYVFSENGGTTEIFMSGNSFVGMRSTDSRGTVLSAIYVDYLTNKYHADKSVPPSGYTEYSGVVKAISFVSKLMKNMDMTTEQRTLRDAKSMCLHKTAAHREFNRCNR